MRTDDDPDRPRPAGLAAVLAAAALARYARTTRFGIALIARVVRTWRRRFDAEGD